MAQAHDFSKGDKVIVTDHHTTVGVYRVPCYVQEVDGDYYVMRKRSFVNDTFRVGKYYPHMEKE